MIKAGKITGKEDYQLIKRQFHEIKNEESDAGIEQEDPTVDIKTPSIKEEASPSKQDETVIHHE